MTLIEMLRANGSWESDAAASKLQSQANRIEKLEAALRKIKDLHDQPGPEDEQVIMIRDDMTYFIVYEALEGKDE